MKLYPLILGLLLVASSCNDDDPSAPPITAENTFSCKINGELFVPEDHGGFPIIQRGILVSQFDNNWELKFGNGPIDVDIYIVDVIETGDYTLARSDGRADFFKKTENLMEVDLQQVTGSTHVSTSSSGSIEVLELEVNKRVILQFEEIVLENLSNPEETIVLTEGKLNINLDTLFEEE